MLSSTTIWITFVIYLGFLLTVAVIDTRMTKTNSARGFATAGGSIKWPILVMTYIASLMSTWVFFCRPRCILSRRHRLLGIGIELYLPFSGHRTFCYEQGLGNKQYPEIHNSC